MHITLHCVCHRSLSLVRAVRNSLLLHVYDGKSPRKQPVKHTVGLDCDLVQRRRLISHLHGHPVTSECKRAWIKVFEAYWCRVFCSEWPWWFIEHAFILQTILSLSVVGGGLPTSYLISLICKSLWLCAKNELYLISEHADEVCGPHACPHKHVKTCLN